MAQLTINPYTLTLGTQHTAGLNVVKGVLAVPPFPYNTLNSTIVTYAVVTTYGIAVPTPFEAVEFNSILSN